MREQAPDSAPPRTTESAPAPRAVKAQDTANETKRTVKRRSAAKAETVVNDPPSRPTASESQAAEAARAPQPAPPAPQPVERRPKHRTGVSVTADEF